MSKQKKHKGLEDSNEKYLVLPAIIVTAIVTQVAFAVNIIFSLLKWNLNRPDQGITFAGLDNYKYVFFVDKEFYRVFFNTIYITVIALIICVVFGILFAQMLNKSMHGQNIVRTLMLLPFFVMSSVTGIVWKTLFLDGSNGWLGLLFEKFPALRITDFVGTYPLQIVTVLTAWQWLPFFVLVILSGFQDIPQEIIESGKVDGATGLQSLLRIQLPVIKGHIEVAIMLGLIFILKEIGIINTATAGGPGSRSTNLAFYIYKAIFFGNNIGRSAALSVVTVVITLFVLNIIYNKILAAQREGLQ